MQIPKVGMYSPYGEADRKVEINASAGHNTFIMILQGDVPKGEVRLDGRFVFTANHKLAKQVARKKWHI